MFIKSKKKISGCIALVMIVTALFSGSVFATEDTEVPSPVTNLTASKIASSAIELSWSASTDNVGVDHYLIWNMTENKTYTTTSTEYVVCGLDQISNYEFYVMAEDAVGNCGNADYVAAATPSQTQANTTYQVYGKVKPDCGNSNTPDALKDFFVAITFPNHPSESTYTVTNANGEYMFPMVPYGYQCVITISKPGFLTRNLSIAAVTTNKTIHDQGEEAIIIWAGDCDPNGAINMADTMVLNGCMNSVRGDSRYLEICDYNKDGAINMIEEIAQGAHFNTTPANYTTNFAVSIASVKEQY